MSLSGDGATGQSLTEITLSGGGRLRIDGTSQEVETAILSAARGSLLELAWLTEADSGHRVGINPDHVVMLRDLGPDEP